MPFNYPEVGTRDRENGGEWTPISGGAERVLRLLVLGYDAELHPEEYNPHAAEIYRVFASTLPEDFEELRAALKVEEERAFLRSAEWEMEKRVIEEEFRQRREGGTTQEDSRWPA